jgi:Hg(II)-responsive transcriptional regulator
MRNGLTISRAAERAGVGIETIRFYERRGLIKQPPRPRSGGFRYYEQDAVERIRFIRQAQELGFSLREIKELLALRADPAADCGDVRKQAVTKRAEVDRKIGQLQSIRAALDELIVSCPGGGALRACTIIDALARPSRAKADKSKAAGQGLSDPRQQYQTANGHGVKTAIFKIDGMHCVGCARTIESLVATEPGVRKATVSYESREARILFEPNVASEDRLADVIGQAGYSVVGRAS